AMTGWLSVAHRQGAFRLELESDLQTGFAFISHRSNQASTVANDDVFTLCPGLKFEEWLGSNDLTRGNQYIYTVIEEPTEGNLFLKRAGTFAYSPSVYECGRDSFRYQLCDLETGICDTASVQLIFQDDRAPNLVNVPAAMTVSCDEQIPAPALVSAFDNCPRIGIDLTETSTAGEDGCSQYQYELTRTWTATDLCGNATAKSQSIVVEDVVAPDIFRIYTLPNGQKLVAGVAEMTNQNWKTVPFPIDFATIPLVFTQVISQEDRTPVLPQVRGVSKAQFELHLLEEAANDNLHARESVAWIAVEKGTSQRTNDLMANISSLQEETLTLNFDQIFSEIPLLFTALQTAYTNHPILLEQQSLTARDATLEVLPEYSTDLYFDYTSEELGYLSVLPTEQLLDENGDVIGEVGQATIGENKQQIDLSHNYFNPVIIASVARYDGDYPPTARVDQLSTTSFEVTLQNWEYLDHEIGVATVNYLVVEGSVPLYNPDFCEDGGKNLIIGEHLKAVDNCDNAVDLTYTETQWFDGGNQVTERTWQSTDECQNEITYTQQVTCEGIALSMQTYLQGALIGSAEEGLMRDDLRQRNLIPLTEPYTELLTFEHAGQGGGEQIDPHLLLEEGPNAIVDWVLIEIRNGENAAVLVATSAGLLQRDGDIISTEGDSLIIFENVPFGAYYVAVRHRNHIGMITKTPQIFGFNQMPNIDFRNIFTPTEGNRPAIKIDNQNAQWSGDLNGDGKTIYQGPRNDPFEMFLAVILDDNNRQFLTNYIHQGYTQKDFNLDGTVIFQGPDNDRSSLLFNTILSHPDNEKFLANFIVLVDTNENAEVGDDEDDIGEGEEANDYDNDLQEAGKKGKLGQKSKKD
ncbi:MAG: hypothetical protein AAGJ18_21025, partial [Bacteroidota bacterium]